MDSGIDFDHPDLSANMWTNSEEVPGNGIDDDDNGYVDDVHGINTFAVGGGTVADDFFHGTHLAGIVGAACNNRIGICGVSPVVKLMGCKFLDGSGNGYTSDAVRCLNYAITMGADVTLNSYGVFLLKRGRGRESEMGRNEEKKADISPQPLSLSGKKTRRPRRRLPSFTGSDLRGRGRGPAFCRCGRERLRDKHRPRGRDADVSGKRGL